MVRMAQRLPRQPARVSCGVLLATRHACARRAAPFVRLDCSQSSVVPCPAVDNVVDDIQQAVPSGGGAEVDAAVDDAIDDAIDAAGAGSDEQQYNDCM